MGVPARRAPTLLNAATQNSTTRAVSGRLITTAGPALLSGCIESCGEGDADPDTDSDPGAEVMHRDPKCDTDRYTDRDASTPLSARRHPMGVLFFALAAWHGVHDTNHTDTWHPPLDGDGAASGRTHGFEAW